MTGHWSRRGLLLAAGAVAMTLAACGSGSIDSQLAPTRVVAFGDGFADVGQAGNRFTVNDGSVNIWTQQVAASFGRSLTPAAAGGTSFATRNARVAATPDAAGNAGTPTVEQQIGSFLAAGAPQGNDLVMVSAGTSDVIYEAFRAMGGAQSREQAQANIRAAGRTLGTQVRRLVQAGAKYVVVSGPYNMDKSPWAAATNQGALLADLSGRFNEELLVSIVDLGANVLYVDAALFFNLAYNSPGSYNFSNVTTLACNSVDPGVGIGTGAGQVNSALCTPATLQGGIDPARWLFADRVYPTPQGHRLFGDYAYSRIRERW